METYSLQCIKDNKSLGEFVRKKRKEAGLRIDDAAALCGVAVETLHKIETAKADIKLSSLLKVLNGLGIEMNLTEK